MIKELIRSAFWRLGIDIRRVTPLSNPVLQLARSLDHFDIDLVLDVGANAGQFASRLRSAGYRGSIVSFEPLAGPYAELEKNASRDPGWRAHPRSAIGARDEEVEINVSGNSFSSSVLEMTEAHTAASSSSAYVGTERVPMATLDTAAGDYVAAARRPFLKIDVQGFEWQVLDGARAVLPHLQGVLCELSLVHLYEGQRLWSEVMGRLQSEGFDLWALYPGFSNRYNGRTMQLDGVFFRPYRPGPGQPATGASSRAASADEYVGVVTGPAD